VKIKEAIYMTTRWKREFRRETKELEKMIKTAETNSHKDDVELFYDRRNHINKKYGSLLSKQY